MWSNHAVLWHQYSVQHDVFVMLIDAFYDSDTGFPIRYRFMESYLILDGYKPKLRTADGCAPLCR